MTLTDEQMYAVDSLDINCIVPAGAGSGKTRVLVERYLRIIEKFAITDPNIIESVVAITFTEKAAKEMKERIRLGMIERRERAVKKGDPDQTLMWRSNLQKLERASISTIHSFCARVLREFPLEADIDPEFKVIDAIEADWILTEVVEQEVKKYLKIEDAGLTTHFYQWVSLAGYGRALKQIKMVYHQTINSGLSIDEVEQLTDQSFKDSPYSMVQDWEKLIALGDELFYAEGSSKRLEEFQAKWTMLKEQIIAFIDKPSIESLFIDQLFELTKGNFGSNLKELRGKVNATTSKIKEWLAAISYHSLEKEFISSFYSLLKNIDHAYLKEKEKLNGIDFDELQLKTIKLLIENVEVRSKLRRRILFLMIDEFQDNNQVQKKLVSLLLKDEKGDIRPGSLFVVGDPKQSIYRFRGADVQVFKDMEEEIKASAGRVAPLVYNFRSSPKIIEFVNYFFPYIMSDNPGSPNFYKNAIAKKELELDDAIEFIPIFEINNDEQSLREIEAQAIAKKIELLINNGVNAKDITILFRSLTNISIYEEALKNLAIPYYIVGGRGFYYKQEIYDLVNVLEYLIDPNNSIALVGILRSPMVAITDDTLYQFMSKQVWKLNYEEWYEALGNINNEEKKKINHFLNWHKAIKEHLGRIRIDELIEKILEFTQYRAILLALPQGSQAVANIEKLIRLAKDFPGNNAFSVYEFVQRINRLKEDEQQEKEAAIESEAGNTVKLMSIHQSKGLEFPYVLIPDISRKPVPDDNLLRFSSELGLSCQIPSNNEDWQAPIRWLYLTDKEKKVEREESVRLFYVAATRAENKLILSGKIEELKGEYAINDALKLDTWSKWFDLILNYKNISLDDKKWIYSMEDGTTGNINIAIFEEDNNRAINKTDFAFITDFDIEVGFDNEIIDYTEPLKMPAKATELTISAIKRYLFCPRHYYFADRLNLFSSLEWLKGLDIYTYDDERVEENENETSLNMQQFSANLKGTLVHELLEQLTIYPEKVNIWRELLKKSFLFKGYKLNAGNETEWIQFEEEVNIYITNFKNSRFFASTLDKSIKTEYGFLLELINGKIRGTIDRLDINPDGTFNIIDYKTDTKVDKERYLPQILTYALAIKKTHHLEPKDGIIYFIRYNHLEEFPISNDELIAWEIELESIMREMNNLNAFSEFKPDYNNCSVCQFRNLCNRKE